MKAKNVEDVEATKNLLCKFLWMCLLCALCTLFIQIQNRKKKIEILFTPVCFLLYLHIVFSICAFSFCLLFVLGGKSVRMQTSQSITMQNFIPKSYKASKTTWRWMKREWSDGEKTFPSLNANAIRFVLIARAIFRDLKQKIPKFTATLVFVRRRRHRLLFFGIFLLIFICFCFASNFSFCQIVKKNTFFHW